MTTPDPDSRNGHTEREQRVLEALFQSHYEAVMRYARRRIDDLADAEEIAAQTFVVAWRHLDDLPAPDERLFWLYGIARRVLANHRRSVVRRLRLHAKLQAAPPTSTQGSSQLPDVLLAMDRLRAADQEILHLTAWEGLSPAESGAVLGISPNAAAIRLHRARGRLKAALHDDRSTGLRGFRRIRTFVVVPPHR